MAAVFSSTSPPRTPRRRSYRTLIGILAIQAFANQMAASFWLVYLVSPPHSLAFDVAILVWVIGFGVAACTVLWIARGRPIQATTSMVAGLAIMVLGHLSFAFLPALWGMLLGSVCFGLYVPLFWLPLNSLVVRETNHANRAGRLAGITATFAITGVLAPIVGGWIADRASYRLVFELAGVAVTANLLLVRWLSPSDHTLVFWLDLKRVGRRTALAVTGQGGVDGLVPAAPHLAQFTLPIGTF